MGSYAAMARIERPAVRGLAWRTVRGQEADDALQAPAGPMEPVAHPAIEPGDGEGLGERLADLRAAWAQTTFYLFSPEAWR